MQMWAYLMYLAWRIHTKEVVPVLSPKTCSFFFAVSLDNLIANVFGIKAYAFPGQTSPDQYLGEHEYCFFWNWVEFYPLKQQRSEWKLFLKKNC